MALDAAVAVRFWSKVDRSGECWLWTSSLAGSGYPSFWLQGRSVGGHRVAYELTYGPIPDGLDVCHKCDNPLCVNPSHLFLATRALNNADKIAKGRCFTPWPQRPKADPKAGKRWTTTPANFWPKADRSGGCWLWKGKRNRRGYGVVSVNNRSRAAHRVAYEFAHGPIPPGLSVLHRCDNPACIRPEHLFAGTHHDNMRDMREKGRALCGKANAATRLTVDQVREIRRRYATGSIGTRLLAREYGVGRSTIQGIVSGKTWQHVTEP